MRGADNKHRNMGEESDKMGRNIKVKKMGMLDLKNT